MSDIFSSPDFISSQDEERKRLQNQSVLRDAAYAAARAKAQETARKKAEAAAKKAAEEARQRSSMAAFTGALGDITVTNPEAQHNLETQGRVEPYPGAPDYRYVPASTMQVFKRMISESDNPVDTEYRLNSAYALSNLQGIPLEQAYTEHDSIMASLYGKAMEPKTGWQKISNMWKATWLGADITDSIDSMIKDVYAGKISIDKLESSSQYKRILELEKQMPPETSLKNDIPTWVAKNAFGFLPSILATTKQGALGGLAGMAGAAAAYGARSLLTGVAEAGTAAVVGSITGLTIPALSLGVVSIPLLLLAGYQLGGALQAGMKGREMERASAFYGMLKYVDPRTGERINPKAAIKLADIYSGFAGLVEASQWDEIFKNIPGIGASAKTQLWKAAEKTLTNKADAVVREGTFLKAVEKIAAAAGSQATKGLGKAAKESGEEAIQEAGNALADEFAKQVTNKLDGTDITPAKYREIQDRIVDTFIGSFVGFALGQAPFDVTRILTSAKEAGQNANLSTKSDRRSTPIITPDGITVTPEQMDQYKAKAATPLPKGLRIQESAIAEGEESILKIGDKDGKRKGFVQYEYQQSEGTNPEYPGTVNIKGFEQGMDENVKVHLVKALSFRFPGWDIQLDPYSEDTAALKEYLTQTNPRGTAAGLQYYPIPETQAKEASLAVVKAAIKRDLPGWDEQSLDFAANVYTMFGSRMGMTGDELAAASTAPQVTGQIIPGDKKEQAVTGATARVMTANGLKSLMQFTKNANGSTALHEITHTVINFARVNQSTPEVKAFLSEVESAMGVKNGDWDAQFEGWTGEYKGQNKTYMEALTYALEDYFTFGKAPTPEMESIFQKIGRWVMDIYQSLKGARVEMSPEMTAYFDKLIADSPWMEKKTESQIIAELKQTENPSPIENVGVAIESQSVQTLNDASMIRGALESLDKAKQKELDGTDMQTISTETGWTKEGGEWVKVDDRVHTSEPLRPETKEIIVTPAREPVKQTEVGPAYAKAFSEPDHTLEENDILYQGDTIGDLIYKSESVINEKMQGPMPGKNILAMLKSAGVKEEELGWTGLDTFLDTDSKLTSVEVKEYIAGNKLNIKDVTKLSNRKIIGTGAIAFNRIAQGGRGDTLDETTYSRYVLPGGENYREVLFTLPEKRAIQHKSYKWELVDESGKVYANSNADNTPTDRLLSIFGGPDNKEGVWQKAVGEEDQTLYGANYNSPHWDEPNVFAHTRLDDRTIPDGKKILFVEEIQSDWHQEGRKRGYKPSINNLSARKSSDTIGSTFGTWEILDDGKVIGTASGKNKTEKDAITSYVENSDFVADAPFKKTWHEFAFKKILREAISNDYDSVGWTTGEQQAERYDLSKVLNTIDYLKRNDGTYFVQAKGDNASWIEKSTTLKRIEEALGKEIAEKISTYDGDGMTFKTLSGLDLKVGGEGMRGFYDKMLVDYANKIGKKYRSKVETVNIYKGVDRDENDNEIDVSYDVHNLPITEDMRQNAPHEMTLFQGENESSGGELTILQGNNIDEAPVAQLKAQARAIAENGGTWEEFMQEIESGYDEFDRAIFGIEDDLDPSAKQAWYRKMFESAQLDDSKPKDLKVWMTELAANNFSELKAFLSGIWTEVLSFSSRDPGAFADAEELAAWTEKRDEAEAITKELADPIKAAAVGLRENNRDYADSFMKSIYGIIRRNPEEYARIYGFVTGDEKIRALGAEKAKYADIEDPAFLKDAQRLGISERAKLAESVRDEAFAKKIRSGEIVDSDVAELFKKVEAESSKAKKEIAELEVKAKEAEIDLSDAERKIAQGRKESKALADESAKIAFRIQKYLDRTKEIPPVLEMQRKSIEQRRAMVEKKLMEANDWLAVDKQLGTARDHLAYAESEIAKARVNGETPSVELIEMRSKYQDEVRTLSAKESAAKDFKTSPRLATYLAKTEAVEKLRSDIRLRTAEKRAASKLKEYRANLAKKIATPPSDAISVKYAAQIIDIQSTFSKENPSPATLERINALREEIAADIPGPRQELNRKWSKMVFGKTAAEMTTSELEETARVITDLTALGRLALQQKKQAEAVINEDAQESIITAIMGLPGFKRAEGIGKEDTFLTRTAGKFREFDYAFAKMQSFAMLADGGKKGFNYNELVMKERERYRTEQEAIKNRTSKIAEAFSAQGITPNDWYGELVTIPAAGQNGSNVTLNKSQIAALYMALRDEDSAQAAIYGCFFSAEEKDRLTPDELEGIGAMKLRALQLAIDSLTDKDKAVIAAFESDSTAAGPRLAEVMADVYNKPFVTVENYFPMIREGVSDIQMDQQVVDDLVGRTPGNRRHPKDGMTKGRVKISPEHQKPIKLDLYAVWMQSIRQQEHLIAYAEYAKHLDALYNAAPIVQEQIKNAFGKEGLEYVKNYIAEVKNPRSLSTHSTTENAIRYLRGNLGAAYLAFRTSSAMKQMVTSIWPTVPYAGPGVIAKAVQCMANPVKFVQDTENLSTVLKNRSADIIMESVKEAKAKTKIGKAALAVEKIGMKGLEYADRVSVSIGWRAVYDKALSEFGGDSEKAIAKADDIIIQTQPSSRGVDLAPIYRDKGPAVAGLLQFTQALNVIWNNVRFDIPAAMRTHDYKTAIGIATSYAIAGILLNATMHGKDENDEDPDKKYLFWAVTQFSDSIPFVGQDVTRVVQRAITGEKSPDMPDTALPAIAEFLNGAYTLTGGDIDKALERFARGGGMLLGAPVSGLKEAGRIFSGDFGAALGRPKKDAP